MRRPEGLTGMTSKEGVELTWPQHMAVVLDWMQSGNGGQRQNLSAAADKGSGVARPQTPGL